MAEKLTRVNYTPLIPTVHRFLGSRHYVFVAYIFNPGLLTTAIAVARSRMGIKQDRRECLLRNFKRGPYRGGENGTSATGSF